MNNTLKFCSPEVLGTEYKTTKYERKSFLQKYVFYRFQPRFQRCAFDKLEYLTLNCRERVIKFDKRHDNSFTFMTTSLFHRTVISQNTALYENEINNKPCSNRTYFLVSSFRIISFAQLLTIISHNYNFSLKPKKKKCSIILTHEAQKCNYRAHAHLLSRKFAKINITKYMR